MVTRGWGWQRREDWEFGVADANYLKRMDKQQGPTVQHRGCIQHPMIKHNGKEYEKNVCITEPLCYTAEINIVNQLYLNKIKVLKG